MRTRIVHPERLEPEELDAYLADGWYRICQTLMWCRMIIFEGTLRSVVWTRTRLGGWALRPGQRRLLRRVRRRYEVRVGRRALRDAHEALYQRYLTVARGSRSATLHDVIHGGVDHDVFETWEISVWDGERLAAFSWFDLGRAAVQSVIGVYDPADADLSLGYATMLLEAEWAQQRGLEFHYAGYVLPGEPAMDYKLRVGGIEYLDFAGAWRPWGDLDLAHTPTARVQAALEGAATALAAARVPAELRLYDLFVAPAANPDLGGFLSDPLILELRVGAGEGVVLVVAWAPMGGPYRLLRCRRIPGEVRSGGEDGGVIREVELLVPVARLASSPDPARIAREAARWVL